MALIQIACQKARKWATGYTSHHKLQQANSSKLEMSDNHLPNRSASRPPTAGLSPDNHLLSWIRPALPNWNSKQTNMPARKSMATKRKLNEWINYGLSSKGFRPPQNSKEQLITISLNDLHTHRLLPITEESNHTITSASAIKAINTEAKSITLRKAIKNHNKRRTNFTRDP